MSVELHLTPDDRWPIELEELMREAAEAGFVGLGMFRTWVDALTRDALSRVGLRCSEMLALIIRDDAARALQRAEQLSAAAAQAGAPWILTVFEGSITPETVGVAERCAALMADAGTAMAVEFAPLGPVDTLDAGLEMTAAVGHGAKLVVDSWHMCLGPTPWQQLERVPLDEIAYVQFDDALPPISDDLRSETIDRRTVPGDGYLELDRFATTLLERGWTGAVSVEVLGDSTGLSAPELIRRCHESASRYWG